MDTTQKATESAKFIVPEQQKVEMPMEKNSGGIKRSHVSESFDSNKEIPPQTNSHKLALVTIDPHQGVWWKADKNKEKMGKLSDFYPN